MLILFLMISFSIEAKVCNLSKGLSLKQIKTLKRAKKINRLGLNRIILGEKVYKIDILSTEDDQQFIVLLGEAHIKGPRSSFMGKQLTKAFKLRMLEGIPKDEYDYIVRNIEALNNALGWQRVVARILTFNFFGSTISVAGKNGLTFLAGYNAVRLNKKIIKKAPTKTVDDIKNLLPKLLPYTRKGLNLPLEVGEFLTPSSSDAYILKARNIRMTANLISYLEDDNIVGTPLVIIGAAHNKGMMKLLEQDGYKRCDF